MSERDSVIGKPHTGLGRQRDMVQIRRIPGRSVRQVLLRSTDHFAADFRRGTRMGMSRWLDKPYLSDIGQVAVALREVNAIPDHKSVGDGKTNVVSVEIEFPA